MYVRKPNHAIDIDTGLPFPIEDPIIALAAGNVPSAEIEKSIRLSQVAALTADRRILMNAGNSGLSTSDVSLGRGLPSFGAAEQDFVGSSLAGLSVVERSKGRWFFSSPKSELEPVEPSLSHPSANPAEIDPPFEGLDYDCSNTRAIGVRISRSITVAADFPVLVAAAAKLGRAVAMMQEKRVAELLLEASNWGSANVTAASPAWDAASPSVPVPLTDLQILRAASSLPANAVVIPESAEVPFFAAEQVSRFVTGGGRLPDVLVGRARTGAVGTPAYVWSDAAVLVRRPRHDGDVSTLRIFRFNQLAGVNAKQVNGFWLTTRPLQDFGPLGGTFLVLHYADDIRFVDATSGGLVTSVVGS